ncbi:hypothetical protein dsat_2863 [Alkalidesulfovibrio alkalitolerans DSM 16529]|jgi:hypothetical protein|uniref:Uncharacterized protein n=1 Tax=Alkalidesulfovibrio alkalitolerans DSM 16529 TaxID=1121439 RepID=S7UK86_9BACT|nr:hypothetical protein [Alkalidesulfovibrio alkalitolerans]EPR34224.1 hypothetical protein dsat_2863 [Alkalidesulfovibrio alkalitolerans DSM 16529]
MLNPEYLATLREYIESGKLEADFADGSQNKKYAILEFLEELMDVAELADETATRIIFKDSYLETLSGVKHQK